MPSSRPVGFLDEIMHPALTAEPEDILDDIIFAKEMTGETLDDANEERMRARICREIQNAQKALRPMIGENGLLRVWRAMKLEDGDLHNLAAGDGLGECWSWTDAGAHTYYGGRGRTFVFEASVPESDVDWLATLAMHSSGEGEIRLRTDAEFTLTRLRERLGPSKYGPDLRQDLAGEIFHVMRPSRGLRPR